MRLMWMAACAAVCLCFPAWADIALKDANGVTITECSRTVASVEHPCHVMEGVDGGGTVRPVATDTGGNVGVNVISMPSSGTPGQDAAKANAVQGCSTCKAVATQQNGLGYMTAGQTPIVSTFAGTGQSASFVPLAGRGFNVSLWGTFGASVQMERSFDGGTTWLPLTAAGVQLYVWSAPASESAEEDEVGVQYRLNCTSFTSGTVNYRISQ